jgi:hypothetical protein
VSRGNAATKCQTIPNAEGNRPPEGSSVISNTGREDDAFGGVFDHGAYEEDGPVTREILPSPR